MKSAKELTHLLKHFVIYDKLAARKAVDAVEHRGQNMTIEARILLFREIEDVLKDRTDAAHST